MVYRKIYVRFSTIIYYLQQLFWLKNIFLLKNKNLIMVKFKSKIQLCLIKYTLSFFKFILYIILIPNIKLLNVLIFLHTNYLKLEF